jgi:MFS transporter, DHA2 family, methylenomycin A resistance protein
MLKLLILAAGFVMAMIDVTAVNVALPDIEKSLRVPLAGLVWIVDAYTLTFAAMILAGGALADRFGAKVVYQFGLGVFLAGSMLCGAAPSGDVLIVARLIQGAGAALFLPSSLSLLSHQYEDDKKRAQMLGIWSALVGVAASVGPLVGGMLIHMFGWRSVFWVNIPIGLLGGVLAQLYISPVRTRPVPLTLVGHASSVLCLGSLSYALIEGPSRGWFSFPVALAALVAFASVGCIVWRERRGVHPIIPRALISIPGFLALNAVGFLNNFGVFGQVFFLGLYFQEAHSANPLQAGLLLLPIMVTATSGNLLSSFFSSRVGLKQTMLCGWVFGSIGFLAVALVGHRPSLMVTLSLCTVSYFAIGVAIPAMTAMTMQMGGKNYANGAAAALNANRQIGALVGVAIVGSILHGAGSWDLRLRVAYLCFFGVFAVAAGVVHRFLQTFSTQRSGVPVEM